MVSIIVLKQENDELRSWCESEIAFLVTNTETYSQRVDHMEKQTENEAMNLAEWEEC